MNSRLRIRASTAIQDAAKRQRYAESLENAYKIADSNLKEIIDAAKLSEDKYHCCVRPWDGAAPYSGLSEPHPAHRSNCCR